jgi:hypothetical protein
MCTHINTHTYIYTYIYIIPKHSKARFAQLVDFIQSQLFSRHQETVLLTVVECIHGGYHPDFDG